MGQHTSGKAAPIFSMALFVLMLGCILVLTILGSGLYVSLVNSQQGNNSLRASLSYVSARVRYADEAGAVSVRVSEYGDVLVLAEPLEATGYETRIYLHGGSIMEEYVLAGEPMRPEAAQAITKTESFALSLDGDLLTVQTGEGESQILLHTGGAGLA